MKSGFLSDTRRKMCAALSKTKPKAAGGDADLYTIDRFSASMIDDYNAFAFGCPAIGTEVLEEDEFQPGWDAVKSRLCGRKLAIFGSYDWGEGDWMKDWEEDAKGTGALLVADGLICNLTPDAEGEEACRKLGALLV